MTIRLEGSVLETARRLYASGERFKIGKGKHRYEVSGPRMAYVGSGSFPVAGSQLFGDKKPIGNEVIISQPFFLSVNKVTVGDYRHYIYDTGVSINGIDSKNLLDIINHEPLDRPLRFINFHEARGYARWLTSKWLTSKLGCEYFIPSSPQWELAARRAQDLCMPDMLPKDLLRSGYEWTQTRYGDLDPARMTDPVVLEHMSDDMEIRGNLSSTALSDDLCAAERNSWFPDDRGAHIGFRVARKI